MDLDELMTRFASNNGIDKPDSTDGKYLIAMEGVGINCFSEAGKLCLMADIAPVSKSGGQRGADSRLLLDKSLGVIRNQRSSITLDEETGQYKLYQRVAMDQVSPESFQEMIEAFGGCSLYYKGLFGKSPSGPAPAGGIMMP
ncbi:CesT family type III secretion system chaperone [Sansalvadorimonas sp. 2012CJ34-2]|uniref:CesT family type III secretion system chaperone n=1 Tax=Parendozoicomonas callyspongiae TaxID=2942213 RepID=A0ABT0PCA1_9GAMM|nr:CesT family type III secretion system chaperone [Sansalvadorimonas sp. 2012CJ34-2]MCL6269007.1 CesT family type III secretion system chaperone [Sansalvadorimonas sp. 2012CJ34-2]